MASWRVNVATIASEGGVSSCRVQQAALAAVEDRVFHFLDIDAFFAEQVENAGQDPDSIVMPDDQRMRGWVTVRTCSPCSPACRSPGTSE